MRSILVGVVVFFSIASHLPAQSGSTGTVIGTVTDPTGAMVPAARIELEDIATGVVRAAVTNTAGRYAFVGVLPGTYSVKGAHPGFREMVVPQIAVEVGKSYTINLELSLGAAQSVIEVTSTPGAELQTLDASVGSAVGGDVLMMVPTLTRNVTSLLLFQPTSMPQQASTQGSTLGGQVAGAHSDQNSIVLDGGSITYGTSGNNDYLVNFQGGPEGAIPTPVESIQEFRVSTSNPTASFSGASGSETVLVTRRGSNAFHGSGYWYLQNDNLNSNTWDRNRLGQQRPESKDNRFGGSLGGFIPKLPDSAKTYFYMNYEGRRLVASTQVSRLVPSDTLRQGILRFRDAAGNIVSYNLAASTTCGAQGNSACDPRGLGLNPLVNTLWSKYEPAGNDFTQGDGLTIEQRLDQAPNRQAGQANGDDRHHQDQDDRQDVVAKDVDDRAPRLLVEIRHPQSLACWRAAARASARNRPPAERVSDRHRRATHASGAPDGGVRRRRRPTGSR